MAPLLILFCCKTPLRPKASFPVFVDSSPFPPLLPGPVASYVSQKGLHHFAVLPSFRPETDDFMALDVFTPRGCFGSDFPRFRISNANPSPLPPAPHLVSVESSLLDVEYPYQVTGDFKIHPPATDPSRLLPSKEERESAPYFV